LEKEISKKEDLSVAHSSVGVQMMKIKEMIQFLEVANLRMQRYLKQRDNKNLAERDQVVHH